jgi:hypothetical protein
MEMRSSTEPEGSAKIRERVVRARQKQLERFATSRQKLYCNAQMSSRHIRSFCELSADCERLIERAMTQQGLSARAHDRILKSRVPSPIWKMLLTSGLNTLLRRFSTAAWIVLIGREVSVKRDEMVCARPSSGPSQRFRYNGCGGRGAVY